MEIKKKSTLKNTLVVIGNVILFLGLIITFFIYDQGYKQNIYSQNLDEISNINQASANISSTFFSGREAKLRDLTLYIDANQLTLEESMDYIYSSNSDEGKKFEIIGPDFTGYRIEKNENGEYIPLDYHEGYGDMCKIFQKSAALNNSQEIRFAMEFTDGYTAKKSFALYNCLKLKNEEGATVPYTLMVVSTSADFVDRINVSSGYERLATTIINSSGDYIIGNSEFKSDNFFQYLAVFNDWSRDYKKEMEAKVEKTGKGTIAGKNSRGKDSVFVYTLVPEKEWYCVTTVPTECFHNGGPEFSFSVIVVVIMILLLTIDMLYLSRLNRKLRRSIANERIASAAKMDFLSRMSHDMRTPMNGIIGMTRLTQDIPELPEEAKENLTAISDSSAYLLQLINDTLDMNKIESNKFTLNPEIVNANNLIQYIISSARPLADQKQIKIDYNPICLKDRFIWADRVRVQQIFLNILSNAVKFTPECGSIHIEVEHLRQEKDRVYARISVEDTGCGMSEEYLQHIFEPFSQEKTKLVRGQEGTGLGMSIVKNLVEMMGGKIEITSQLQKGTNVTVYMDFEFTEAAPQSAQVHMEGAKDNFEGKRILLAEDHPLNATIATRVLEKKGMYVEHAEDGLVAVHMFENSKENYYDLILMDIRMPRMDGLEAAKNIRALAREDAKEVPIIAMTANAYAEDVQAAISAGMNAHLAKPIEPELLYEEIHKFLQ